MESLLSCVKIALIADSFFFKILSRSIYTSLMVKGSGQGVLKRKKKIDFDRRLCSLYKTDVP